jgi:molybdate transport system ATP-binding protein
MPLLECRILHHWSRQFALDARFTVDGGVTAIFGASGAGKTSILAIIAGLVKPDAATIRLGERTLIDSSRGIDMKPEQRAVGFVPQDHLLFPHLTILENLRFGQQRKPARAIELNRVVDVLELGELLNRKPATLSGGQRQRVALGRAILRGPELLLMDEPLAALDAPLKHRILTYLDRAVRQWNIPTLFVSHDQSDVRRFADSVVVIELGKLIASGPTASTLDRTTTTRPSDDAGPINLLKLEDVQDADEQSHGHIGVQRLHFPNGGDTTSPTCYVRFFPRDVMLSRDNVPGISARNHLHGKVKEITPPLRGRVFVAIDVGSMLWAEVTSQAIAELKIAVDSDVTCHVKSTAISLLR